ncbi:MAG: carboxymuconolactone decarboxylase family protein [Nocardioides sp.]
MSRIHPLEPSEAPDRAGEILDSIIDRHGTPGPMVRTMAHSPALLQGYLDLSRAMKRAKLPRTLSERVSLAVQEWIGCRLCLAAHTDAGRRGGLTETSIALARQSLSTDPAKTTLLGFAVRVLVEPSAITDQDIADLRHHGWTDRAIADVVGLVALNQLTGSLNLVAGFEPDTAPNPETTDRATTVFRGSSSTRILQ